MEAFETGRSLPAQTLDFWFDYTCPYAYLASTRIRNVAERMGVPVSYRPLLLGGVFAASDVPQRLFASHAPAKSAHGAADLERWAHRLGITLRMPAGHPMRSVEALRATLACKIDPAVVDGFYRAYWVEGAPISDPAVIARVVAAAGHDAEEVLAAIALEATKDDLRRRTDEAIALGIFGVPAFVVDGAHLYWGQDRLAFVEGRPRVEPPASPRGGHTLDVYWDFSSPFAYLASTQVDALAHRTGAKVAWHPMLLGGLFKALGTPDAPILAASPAKQRYLMKDMFRWAEYLGVPFRFPSRFPMSTVKALRAYLALPEERRADFRARVFRAYWAEDLDIASSEVLSGLIGPDAPAILAATETDAVKLTLRKATEDAAARGVFGTPTFIVDGKELFWGQDRLELVETALRV